MDDIMSEVRIGVFLKVALLNDILSLASLEKRLICSKGYLATAV